MLLTLIFNYNKVAIIANYIKFANNKLVNVHLKVKV